MGSTTAEVSQPLTTIQPTPSPVALNWMWAEMVPSKLPSMFLGVNDVVFKVVQSKEFLDFIQGLGLGDFVGLPWQRGQTMFASMSVWSLLEAGCIKPILRSFTGKNFCLTENGKR